MKNQNVFFRLEENEQIATQSNSQWTMFLNEIQPCCYTQAVFEEVS